MPLIPIHSLDDPRVAAYRNLKDRELAREGGRFIAEGHLVVHRLLASSFATESVLLAEHRVAENVGRVPEHVLVYVAPAAVVNQIVGFKFHAGVIAVGFRGQSPTIESVMARHGGPVPAGAPAPLRGPDGRGVTWVVAPDVEKSDNLGALIRIAAAFGATGVLLGERSCDPFVRQSVRVSMGTVLSLPVVRSDDLARDLVRLRDDFAVELVASVLADDAEPLDRARRAPRTAVLFGNEFHGLSDEVVGLCRRKVVIPMELGTDSLNVSVAAAVFLYHFTRVAGER